MMYFLLLPCYLIILVALIYQMKQAIKQDSPYVIGITIPKEYRNETEIVNCITDFKRKTKGVIVFIILLIMLGFFLRDYPVLSSLYTFVVIFLPLLMIQLILNRSSDQIYAFKKKKGLHKEETFLIHADTEVTRLKNQFPVKMYHWILVGLLTGVAAFLWRPAKQPILTEYTMMAVIIGESILFFLLYQCFSRIKSKVYCKDSQINIALNRCMIHEMTKSMVACGYLNALGWMIGGFFKTFDNQFQLIVVIVIVTSISSIAVLFDGCIKVNQRKKRYTDVLSDEAFADEDRYWRGGIYDNPNDPKTWVEKRIGIGTTMNQAKTSAKILNIIVFIVLIGTLAMMVYYIPLDFPKLNVTVGDTAIHVSATRYDKEIPFSEITKAELLSKEPKMYKNDGYGGKNFSFGKYRLKEYGQAYVAINHKQKEFILIYTKDYFYLINSSSNEELDLIIKALEERKLLVKQ